MSQSPMVILDDNNVSRMVAEKAMHDQVFKRQLLACVRPNFFTDYTRQKRITFRVISATIIDVRVQIVSQAELKVPKLENGKLQDLNTYLKKVRNSKLLVGKNCDREWGWVATPMCVARLAAAYLESTLRFQADPTPFPFERLPPELRLKVYHEALIGAVVSGAARAQVITVTPTRGKDSNCRFRFGGLSKGESKEINVGLLAANRLVNNEAIAVLFQLRTFDFKTNVSGIVPFLRSVSEQARQNLGGIAMELFDNFEPDHCCGTGVYRTRGKGPGNKAAWSKACAYIGENVNVKALSLAINVKVPAKYKTLKWVEDLVKIRKLKSLTLQVNQHYISGSDAIRASYKEGSVTATDHCVSEHLVPLFEYLREEMLE